MLFQQVVSVAFSSHIMMAFKEGTLFWLLDAFKLGILQYNSLLVDIQHTLADFAANFIWTEYISFIREGIALQNFLLALRRRRTN